MGMYTELVMNVGLKDDIPQEVVSTLKNMIDGPVEFRPPENYKDDPLFKTKRWAYMLNTGSFYFVPSGCSKLVEHDYGRMVRHLSIRTDFKNYNDEIDKFADFIAPFIESYGCDFAGYERYEEDDHPTLLYFEDGKALWKPVK